MSIKQVAKTCFRTHSRSFFCKDDVELNSVEFPTQFIKGLFFPKKFTARGPELIKGRRGGKRKRAEQF